MVIPITTIIAIAASVNARSNTLFQPPRFLSDMATDLDRSLAWLAATREEHVQKPIVLKRVPEICVEIISPSNTASEIKE
jgi:hypothetical protein